MTDKELLTIDLCSRLPYIDTMVRWQDEDYQMISIGFGRVTLVKPLWSITAGSPLITEVKPYLRPMSSMTKKEKKELLNIVCGKKGSKYFHLSEEGIDSNDAEVQEVRNFEFHWINFSYKNIEKATDWLNKKMFDWRYLIPMGLAIEAPKDMYN